MLGVSNVLEEKKSGVNFKQTETDRNVVQIIGWILFEIPLYFSEQSNL